ncbi:hypothetical protein Dsin_003710 [Dipteronia sinensis]|uniref:Uncharacterized protein n=1 Tax=Dipteronia sinensis TaxID=43782 RepID=A0AAE0BA06_9ROSI|nr:hypothetical protein Dsin_003710 [Dipteronia sinensis]
MHVVGSKGYKAKSPYQEFDRLGGGGSSDSVSKEEFHYHQGDWRTVCKSKSCSGLGIGRMGDKNNSLLAKWVWRFRMETDSLWRRVICARYRIPNSDLTWDWKAGSCASPFIKTIASLFVEGTPSCRILKEGLRVVIGKSKRAKFWEATIGESSFLKEMCPRIYALAVQKHGVVNDFGRWLESRWIWEVPLRRPVFDWENDQWGVFKSLLDYMVMRESVSDALALTFCSDGCFTVRSFHKRLEDSSTNSAFDFNLIWQGVCPPK